MAPGASLMKLCRPPTSRRISFCCYLLLQPRKLRHKMVKTEVQVLHPEWRAGTWTQPVLLLAAHLHGRDGESEDERGCHTPFQLRKPGAGLRTPAPTRHWLRAAPGEGWQPPPSWQLHWQGACRWRREELGALAATPIVGAGQWVKRMGVGSSRISST